MALTVDTSEAGAAQYIGNVTPTTLYTNAQGAGKGVLITKLIIANITGGAVNVTIYRLASGGAISGNDWKIVPLDSIDANDREDVRDVAGMWLANGESLRALAGAATSLRWDLSVLKES